MSKGIAINQQMAVEHGLLNAIVFQAIADFEGYAPIHEITELCGFSSKNSIGRCIKYLKSKNMVVCGLTPLELKEIICRKESTQHIAIGNKRCEWCSLKTTKLHVHHYPIRRCKGGTETVSICPNCHQEYHSLENSVWVNTNIGIPLPETNSKTNTETNNYILSDGFHFSTKTRIYLRCYELFFLKKHRQLKQEPDFGCLEDMDNEEFQETLIEYFEANTIERCNVEYFCTIVDRYL